MESKLNGPSGYHGLYLFDWWEYVTYLSLLF